MSDKITRINQVLAELAALHGDSANAATIYQYVKDLPDVPFAWFVKPHRRHPSIKGSYILSPADPNGPLPGSPVHRTGASKPKGSRGDLSALHPVAAPEHSAPSQVMHVSAGTQHVPDNVVPFVRPSSIQQDIGSLVPEIMRTYVPFGAYRDVQRIVESKIFYPVFITGLSGNGKTIMVEQICANLKRNCIRVNFTEETDEDDLIGGNTLIDGNMVYREGPVLTAMRTGSVLILDEVDLGGAKIMCLQSIMEGKPYFNKKTGDMIYPALGFNVFATANTKGRGSESGRFVFTRMMNEAFLERFPITIEQDYPSENVEKKILIKNFAELNLPEEETRVFADCLAKWASVIRKSFSEGIVDDLISTRRLVAIAKAYAIFGDKARAMNLCLSRFDSNTKDAFMDLYTKVDVNVTIPPKQTQEEVV